jgi:hypothetical protein
MKKVRSDIQGILEILRRMEKEALAAFQARPLCSVREVLEVLEFAMRLERWVLGHSAPLPRASRRSSRGRRRTRTR